MKAKIVSLALMGLMMGSGFAPGQPPSSPRKATPPKPAPADPNKGASQTLTLEKMLTQALRNNPDVRIAQAKLREAEANLNQVQLQVAQKAVQLQQDLEAARKQVVALQERVNLAEAAFKSGRIPGPSLEEARAALISAKGKLASLESQVPYLMGTMPRKVVQSTFIDFDNDGRVDVFVANEDLLFYRNNGHGTFTDVRKPAGLPSGAGGGLPESIRKALDSPMGNTNSANTSLGNLLNAVGDERGVSFVFRDQTANVPVDLRLGQNTPVGALLEAIEDTAQVRFIVRDYGILVVPKDAAPPQTQSVRDFWKRTSALKKKAAAKPAS